MSNNFTNDLSRVELGQVKERVMANNQILQNLIPPTVSYTTQGNVLVIGPEDLARLAADKLAGMASCTVLANEAITSQDQDHLEKVMQAAIDVESFYSPLISIKGFLGQFQVIVDHEDGAAELSLVAIRKPHFDIILDLSTSPCLNLEMLPPGYFFVGQDQQKLVDALAQIPDLVGEFDKPRYVKVNANICAHNRNGIDGCNRCLNFCPADAISSQDNKIEIDPYLCHGAGSCSNACPTGALSFDLPTPEALSRYLKKLISQYRSQTNLAPVILFHDNALGAQSIADMLPADVLPVSLEEITVASIEHWLSALAWGARQVLVLNTEVTPATLTQMLEGELALVRRVFEEIGQPQRVELLNAEDLAHITPLLSISQDWPVMTQAQFEPEVKRANIFYALDHLNAQVAETQQALQISNIPYGKVSVNAQSCTLCMSCVAICPTQALTDGGESPALRFVEQDCVQCGLCASACPETIISLTPQINFNQTERQQVQTLHEEKPFECIECGKPFATQSMVHKMLADLAGHSAFSNNIERLKMCGDCRVKDLFEDILEQPEKQLD